jgi:hypothetical protein
MGVFQMGSTCYAWVEDREGAWGSSTQIWRQCVLKNKAKADQPKGFFGSLLSGKGKAKDAKDFTVKRFFVEPLAHTVDEASFPRKGRWVSAIIGNAFMESWCAHGAGKIWDDGRTEGWGSCLQRRVQVPFPRSEDELFLCRHQGAHGKR